MNVAILKVARIGHPVVRMAAAPVPEAEIASADFQRLVDEMVVTMHEYDGVGLAAPQVHVSLRAVVIEVPASNVRSEAAVPLTVLVNPVVTPLGDERGSGWEGCLSVPGLRGVVPGGPADRAGLARGDLILSVDGAPVSSLRELYRTIWKKAPGESLSLQVLRDSAIRVVEVAGGDRYEFYK